MTNRDDHLLSRAAEWPEHAALVDLTPNVLREIAARYGLDFATAVLYDRVTRSVEHGPTIERIMRTQSAMETTTHAAGVIGIMPGAFYIESPHTGADGHGLAPEAQRRGWRCELIGAKSFGSLAENAAVLRQWLADHRDERVVLVSLSKGGAEVKWALHEPHAAETFQNVSAWINVSGILNGSPLVRWLLDRPWRALLARMLFWFRGHQFSVLHELAYGSDTPLDFPLQLPEHLLAIHVIGFPLAESLSSNLARRGYRRLLPWGPNDAGGIVLSDVCDWPGVIYPIWRADHYLRTPGREPSSIIGGLLDWLGSELSESNRELRESNRSRHSCRPRSSANYERQEYRTHGQERGHMKIQLLLPAGEIHRNNTGIFKRSLRYAPLTLTTLAALVPDELDIELTLQDEGVQPLELDFDADLVAISCITGTALRGYAIADRLRARGQTVVIGGVHATLLDEAAQHADAIVTGYAEQSWPQLLRDFAQGRMQKRYFTPTGRHLAGIPHARRDLLDRKKYTTINSIEATRGCPHKCDFCAVPAAWANTYSHRPVEEVVAELETFQGRTALFIDLSPVEDVAYAKSLYRAMIPLGMRWVGLATTRIAEDDELLKLAAQSGCKGLLIGFESVSQATLNQTQKHFHSADQYAEIVRKLHDHGIGIQGCFVFGFDNDNDSVFERTVEFVDRTKIDLPRYAVMTPFPGTGAFRQLEAQGRLLHKDWSLYDVEHVVFSPKQMTPERLQAGLEWSWRQSYSWKSLFTRVTAAPWSIVPLWISLNLGYKYYARHLPQKTGPTIYRDQVYLSTLSGKQSEYQCRSKAQSVELLGNLKNAQPHELSPN